MNTVSFLYDKFFSPKLQNEEGKRQEFILNILLISLSGLFFLLSLQIVFALFFDPGITGASPIFAFAVLGLFLFLLFLSRRGWPHIASRLLIAFFFFLVTIANYTWGADLPMAVLFYCFIIVISGILISSRFAFIVSLLASVNLIFLETLVLHGSWIIEKDWKAASFGIGDVVGLGFSFILISIFSWLSNRDLEKSLARARASEAALQAERDQLEIIVEERTKQLKEAQESQLEQMTRFAEFGQLASGIMHDLANPLTSMSINLQLAKDQAPTGARDTAKFMDQALQATERMEELVQVARKQFRKRPDVVPFLLSDEIEQAVQLLQSKARPAHVRFDIEDIEQIETVGSPLKFHRVILNLLANAIEAYVESRIPQEKRQIRVTCHEVSGDAVIEVIDQAGGIPDAYLPKIFQPFFTTKANGSGIGLPTVKEILEKDFDASIQARNSGSGALFEIRLPIRKDRP